MKMLNSEMKSLLDKLYNLRGEDSVILVSMAKETEKALETKEKTSVLKTELQAKINELSYEENSLASEGERLKSVLDAIKKEEFATVISCLDIDFDPEAIKRKIETQLPLTLEKVVSEKEAASEKLVKVEDEMNAAITKIEELSIRRDEALSNQERLNRYFELALSSNINITREEITSLLAQFSFTEEEQREAAKVLMFPEDGLFEYEEHRFDNPVSGKSISEVIQEAKETTPEIVYEDVKPTEKDVKLEESETSSDALVEEIKVTTAEELITPTVETNEEKNEHTKEDLIELLTKLGLDYLDFTNNDFAKILEKYNEELFTNNVALIDELKISKDIFNDNIELLSDEELKQKIEKLTEIGKQAQDIYLNPDVLVKYDLNELNNVIKVLSESGLDPKSVPLMAY